MSGGGEGSEGARPLWRFVPADRVELPPEPATESVRRGWRRLAGKLGTREAGPEQAGDDEEGPTPPPRPDLTPRPDAEGQAAALAEALKGAGSASRMVVIDPPGSRAAETLEHLARRWGLPALGPEATPADLLAADGPVAVPRLERMFLRTPAGLERARVLVDALLARPHPVLLGCGSWAWRYLDAALGVGLGFPRRLAPAPLDAARLRHWLGSVPGLRCRDDGGARLVGDGDGRGGGEAGEDSDEAPAFFRHLAAKSRGSPGVAAALWALALGQGASDGDGGGTDDGALVVPRWRRLRLPNLGAEPAPEALLCLQALLVHGPLDGATLARLLPVPAHALGLHLARLEAAGVTGRADDGAGWQVAPAAYPAARQALADAGHWVDG